MNQRTYQERYNQGEEIQVWNELRAYNKDILSFDLLQDATAVAHETMRRSRQNIETIIDSLKSMGYRFKDPLSTLELPKPYVSSYLDELETLSGGIPLSLRAWYKIVGAVDLRGTHPDWPDSGVNGETRDPLVVYSIDIAMDMIRFQQRNNIPLGIYMSDDQFFKEDMSGGEVYEISLPQKSLDAPIVNFSSDDYETLYFIDYLRLCFRWGGFPGIRHFSQNEAITQAIALLTKNLLPI